MLKLKFKNKQQGFTIVELLIVIVVIGILATITIVAYNNVNDKARASSAVSALDQAKKKLELYKAENGGYPADLNTIGILDSPSVAYEYTNSANTDYCLTATVSNISYYLNNSTKTSPAEGGCSDHTWPGGVAMTNLVTNGDFSQGMSGWTASYGTATVVGDIVSLIGNGSATSSSLSRNTAQPVAPGERIYIHMYGRVTNPDATNMYVRIQGSVSGNSSAVIASMVNSPSANSWSILSGVITQPPGLSGNLGLRTYQAYGSNAMQSGKKKDAKYFTVINLTAAFGAGNEPTKEQMDQIMEQFPNSWFNGTVTANTKGVL